VTSGPRKVLKSSTAFIAVPTDSAVMSPSISPRILARLMIPAKE
jgi:hypothetical protein